MSFREMLNAKAALRRLVAALVATGAILSFGSVAIAQPTTVVVEGDSLFSVNNFQSNWTQFFSQPGTALFNHAAGGETIQQIVGQYPAQDHSNAAPNAVFILEGGVNDISNIPATANQTYSNALAVLLQAAADGFSNLLCTIAPASPLTPAKEIERLNYNTLVRNGTSNGYAVLDVEALISPNTNDLRYYQTDGIHWTAKYESWLGRTVIPNQLGFPGQRPSLNLVLTSSNVTITWTGRPYSTNTLLRTASLEQPVWTNVADIVVGASGSCMFQTNRVQSGYFRLRASHLDFPTYYNLFP